MSEVNTELEAARAAARSLGIQYHHKAGADTIKALIHGHLSVHGSTEKDVYYVPPLSPKLTPDQVLAAIQQITNAFPDFTATFTEDTWTFKRRGMEDSGNLQMPASVIRRKAELVSRGARVPKIEKDGNGGFLWA